jgi:hypothetical protein
MWRVLSCFAISKMERGFTWKFLRGFKNGLRMVCSICSVAPSQESLWIEASSDGILEGTFESF